MCRVVLMFLVLVGFVKLRFGKNNHLAIRSNLKKDRNNDESLSLSLPLLSRSPHPSPPLSFSLALFLSFLPSPCSHTLTHPLPLSHFLSLPPLIFSLPSLPSLTATHLVVAWHSSVGGHSPIPLCTGNDCPPGRSLGVPGDLGLSHSRR